LALLASNTQVEQTQSDLRQEIILQEAASHTTAVTDVPASDAK
jgi:hypothetical protein